MTANILNSIIDKKQTCYFISPHFDDAALSAGALMTYLHTYVPVVVINVFTEADTPPYTMSAKSFLKQCGFVDGQSLYKMRASEDTLALEQITREIINLHFTDALWRKKTNVNIFIKNFTSFFPELIHIYPTYYFHITRGVIYKDDFLTLQNVKKSLNAHIPNGVVFCPLGIGNHVDHILVKWACEDTFDNLIYWADYPYTYRQQIPQNDSSHFAQTFTFEVNDSIKRNFLKKYNTQYQALFGNNPPILGPEKFYVKSSL